MRGRRPRAARLAHAPPHLWPQAARFGVNPWQLMEWLGHKRINETMGYVHVAGRHRSLPSELVAADMKERIRRFA